VRNRALLVFFSLLLAAITIWAQAETGQITGVVTDATGAAIPKAEIEARNVATGTTRSTTATQSGDYIIPNLQAATYDVTISAAGFGPMKQRVVVGVGVAVGVNAQLKVGTTSTSVEVVESAVAVNIENQSLTDVINSQQVLELPSLTRNPYDFVATLPNVAPDMGGRGVGYMINGVRAAGTNVLLDGVPNNNEFSATVGQPVPLDSVQEYSVTTSSFTAEQGRADGGIVNVVTRSGSNAFHGTAYEFNRVSALGSNSFYNNAYGLPKGIYDRNLFGYSIGGPIVKNKLFFFQNTEWTRVRSGANEVDYIPTPQFIAAAAPATQAFFAAYGALRSGLSTIATYTKSQLTALGQNPCAGAAAGGGCNSLAGNTPLFSKVTYTAPADAGGGSPQNTYNLVGRVDYAMTDRTQFYVRYALYNENDFPGTNETSPYSGFDTGSTNVNNAVVISGTHTFSPSFVSQTKADFNRLNNLQSLGTAPVGPTLYMSSSATAAILGTNIAFPGYNAFTPGSAIPFGGPQNVANINQDFSKIVGKHTFRFGGLYTYIQDNRVFGAYEEAVEALSSGAIGNSLDNFLAGNLKTFTAAVNPQGKFPGQTLTLPVGPPSFSRSNLYNEGAAYAQDSWRIRPRLTLNLGVRWEYFGTQHDKNANLDANFYTGGTTAITPASIRAGSVFTAPTSPIGELWKAQPLNFAPRLGFAWDVFGNGKTSLRGGYGIGYERNFGNVTYNVIQNPPNYATVSLTAGTDLPTIPISVSNSGPLAGSSGSKVLPAVSLRFVDNNIKTAYAHSYSLTLEHSIGSTILASVGYSGSAGENLYSIDAFNKVGSGNAYNGDPCVPGTDGDPGTCTSRSRLTQYSSINGRTNGGISNYNALIGRVVVKNFARSGVTLDANYTWSHAIDNLSSTFSDGNQGAYELGFLDPYNPGLDRGNGDSDIPQRVAISGIWQVPGYKGSNWKGRILGGWEVVPLFTAQSSNGPITLYDCQDAYNYCSRAFIDGVAPTSGNSNIASAGTPDNFDFYDFSKLQVTHWFNPKYGVSDFGPFPADLIARNSVHSPGSWNMDLGVYKNTAITEKMKLQLRLEMYNVFNHSNFYVYGTDTDTSSFNFVDAFRSQSTNTSVGRNVQLGAKIVF
jgi:Carboxypeptidase regulatory-like domain/TonB dependent receptor/TonB-dependent Receptor Plug Domain